MWTQALWLLLRPWIPMGLQTPSGMARRYQKALCVSDFCPVCHRYFLFAERELLYRLVEVHHSKEQSETLFQLISEGTFYLLSLILPNRPL